jgi:transcriptional regulator with XRE-family HTH domain
MTMARDKEPTSPLGHIIRDARLRKNLSQGVLGEKVGVARQTIGEWEAGKPDRSVPPQKLRALAGVLDVPFDALLDAAMERAAGTVEELEAAEPEQFSPEDRVFLKRLKKHNPTQQDYEALLAMMDMIDRHREEPPAPK